MYNVKRKMSNFHVPSKPNCKSNLQNCLKYILILAQIFGLFPINGVGKTVNELKFSWKSLKCLYSILITTLIGLYTISMFYYCLKSGENIFSYSTFVWNFRAFCGMLALIKTAVKWPSLLREWNEMEVSTSYETAAPNFMGRFAVVGILYVIVGLVEYCGFIVSGVYRILRKPGGSDEFIKTYFVTTYVEFFWYTEFSYWTAMLVWLIGLSTRIIWQFMNYFLVIMSSALALRFQQLTNELTDTNHIDEDFITQLRVNHARLSNLCDKLNDTLGEVILIAFGGNLYFTSTVLFQNIKPRDYLEDDVFYYINGLCTFLHTFVLCVYTSWVFEESRKPLIFLAALPINLCPDEIERIIEQIDSKPVAINAMDTFSVTRKLVVEMASIVIVLQLLLMNFDKKF